MSNEVPNSDEIVTLRALAHQVLLLDQEILQLHERMTHIQNNYTRLYTHLKALEIRIERLEECVPPREPNK